MNDYTTTHTLMPQEPKGPQEPQEPNILKNKYENMSFEEMSLHMAESNRQISEMLSSTSSTLSTTSIDTIEAINQDDPHVKYTQIFSRTASSGNVEKLRELLSDATVRRFIDINARDSDGTPPLIYAACFGKTEIAKVLIEFGAHIDTQDSCK